MTPEPPKEIFAVINSQNDLIGAATTEQGAKTCYKYSYHSHTRIHRYTLDEWIPVSEPPEISADVITGYFGEQMHFATYDGKWFIKRDGSNYVSYASHYRPMPAPPMEGK
jgi:hypothetical protein